MSKLKSPPDRTWAEHDSFGIFGRLLKPRRRRSATVTIPESRADYDLWEMLNKCLVVVIHTIDGTVIHAERTDLTRVNPGTGQIHDVKFTIWHLGQQRVFENVTCQQHCSAWKTIDPTRRGLFWSFTLHETTPEQINLDLHGRVQVVAAI